MTYIICDRCGGKVFHAEQMFSRTQVTIYFVWLVWLVTMTATIWSYLNWLCGINLSKIKKDLWKRIPLPPPPWHQKYLTSDEGLPQSLLLLWQLQKAPWQVNHPQTFIFTIQFMTQGLSFASPKYFANIEFRNLNACYKKPIIKLWFLISDLV